MKTVFCSLLPFLFLFQILAVPIEVQAELKLTAPSVLLMEESTGTILYEKNADEQRSPASITKIMTLILIFDELEKGSIQLTDEVVTSAYAKSMGGSQVFLEEGERQSVETLIKCIVISSGNDASVAMAEYIAGSESEFVARMNARAAELQMTATRFEDCCGLTDSEGHYTTARDVALMSRELILHYPQVLQYSSIWMEDITHVTAQGTKPFTLSNTNKLIRSYEGCLGLKTGSTSTAKYCVSAVAQRNEMTLIAVVMGAPDHKVRFADASAMLNYGFGTCKLFVDEHQETFPPVPVEQSIQQEVHVACEEEFRFLETEGRDLSQIQKTVELPESVTAPLRQGESVGRAVYMLDGQELGSVAIVCQEDVEQAGYRDYLRQIWERYLGAGTA